MELLRQCADYLKQLGQPLIAAEVYEKMEDKWAHIMLYVDLKQWDMVCLDNIYTCMLTGDFPVHAC